MAPVPDMGGDIAPVEPQIKREMAPSAPQASMEPAKEAAPPPDSLPPSTSDPSALHAAPEAPMDDLFNIGDGGAAVGNNPGEFNFTDITFSLAPVNGESQDAARARQPEMDMSAFGNEDMSSLDNMLPTDALMPAATAATAAGPGPGPGGDLGNAAVNATAPQDKTQGANADASDNLDDMFTLGGDGGMELDSSNFDSMFFTEMDDVKYDDDFFNIAE